MSVVKFKKQILEEYLLKTDPENTLEPISFESYLVNKLYEYDKLLDERFAEILKLKDRPDLLTFKELEHTEKEGIYIFYQRLKESETVFVDTWTVKEGILGEVPDWFDIVPPTNINCILLLEFPDGNNNDQP